MAFNPFTWFRKNQKVFLAILAIFIMFLFVGSFGRGDLVDWATRQMGMRATGQTVTILNGKKIREGDVHRYATNRRLASNFLFENAWEHHGKVCDDLLKSQLQSTAQDNPLSGLRKVVESAKSRAGLGLVMSRVPPNFIRMQIEGELKELEFLAAGENVLSDPERFELVRQVATILGFQLWLLNDQRISDTFGFAQLRFQGARYVAYPHYYFGGSDRIEDLLDFLVWRTQADRLGIQLTDQDVLALVNEEAADSEFLNAKMGFNNDPRVKQFLDAQPDRANLQLMDLIDGLREEFRVVMAQAALLGSEPGVRAYRLELGAASSPGMVTPDEFRNYFREQRTTLRVQLLTVPVSQFFDQVKDKPTETELQTRFDRYREREPRANSREPGFKEPRRVQVEYVYASPTDPHYRELGKVAFFGPWAIGCFSAANALEATALLLSDPLQNEYERDLVNNDSDWFYKPLDSLSALEDRSRKLHYGSVLRPATLASMVGGQISGSSLGALIGLYSTATFEEVKTSARFTLTQLLANSNPQQTFGNAALFAMLLPEPPSFKVMQPQLLAAALKRSSESEFQTNLRKFIEELQKKSRNQAKELQEFVAASVKNYHLQHQRMPRAMTREALTTALKKGEDLNLAPLREAGTKSLQHQRVEDFVEDLFPPSQTTTIAPNAYANPEPDQTTFIFWRAQDLPSRPREYAQAKSDVEAAWRLEKARQLARKEAERLEDEINGKKFNAADAVRFLREQKFGPTFELDNVAQLLPPREVLAARRTEYSPYQIPEEKRGLFEFPPPDLAKRLLRLTRPGQAMVVVDEPGKHYFVAVLLDRTEPSFDEFKAIYARTPREDSLFSRFLDQQRERYRETMLTQLRREVVSAEFIDKEGRFIIPDFARRDSMSRDDDE